MESVLRSVDLNNKQVKVYSDRTDNLCNLIFFFSLSVLCNVSLQIWAARELSGYAPAADQKDHEEAEGGAQRPVQTSGQ